jgi:diguanylate cyclase (GGDEF)-like protein
LGADEVVVWRAKANGTYAASAWSSMVSGGLTGVDLNGDVPDTLPPCFRFDTWMPRVAWAATQQMMQFERRGPDGKPWDGDKSADGAIMTLAVAPVVHSVGQLCALSASAGSGLKASEDQIRNWLTRSAGHSAELAELIHGIRQSERQVKHASVLVNSAKRVQSKRSVDGLAESVCLDALQVTGGKRAALVKWDEGAQSGYVQSVSPGHSIESGQQVSGGSRVGTTCAEDSSNAWEDARALDRGVPIYAQGERVAPLGSLLVVPMKQEGQVVGAIVVEGDDPRDLMAGDIGQVQTLGAIASASLAQLWRMERVQQASITDQLTGLFNRRHFDEQLPRLLSKADQERQPVSLIVLDVDHFKKVNDTYGHEAGDAVLQGVANVVQHTVRHGGGDICARYGGEEVAILLPGVPAVEALEIAERLRRTLAAKPVVYGGQRIAITASFGVASYKETVSTQAGFFPAADKALYQAKSGGRNCVKSAGGSEPEATTSPERPQVKVGARRG